VDDDSVEGEEESGVPSTWLVLKKGIKSIKGASSASGHD
jgi:hypothetical protein